MTYYTDSYISNGYNRNSRLRAVAANAIREAVIAAGRIDRPYTDNDAAILENVYVLLTKITDSVEVLNEHQELSVPNTKPDAAQEAVYKALGDLADQITTEADPLVKASLPAKKS